MDYNTINQRNQWLLKASKDGYFDTVSSLLTATTAQNYNNDIDINVQNWRGGNTPLHHACCNGHLDIVELLVIHNADINRENYKGQTPLHAAVSEEESDIVQLLLDNDANANIKNDEGNTPLHIACMSLFSDGIVDLLLKNNADVVNIQNHVGDTALHVACSRDHTAHIVQMLLYHKANVNMFNEDGDTPLHIACKNLRADYVELLLLRKFGADSYIKTMDNNKTAKDLACDAYENLDESDYDDERKYGEYQRQISNYHRILGYFQYYLQMRQEAFSFLKRRSHY